MIETTHATVYTCIWIDLQSILDNMACIYTSTIIFVKYAVPCMHLQHMTTITCMHMATNYTVIASSVVSVTSFLASTD